MDVPSKQKEHTRARSVYLNSSITLICQIFQSIVGFIVRKLFVQYLGENYLGYDSVFANILQMLNIAELGISLAITSFLYKPLAEHNKEELTALMYLYKRIYQFIGLIVLVFGIIVSLFLPILIPDAECSAGTLRFYFYISLIGTVSTYYLAYKRALPIANQKSYIVMLVDTTCFFAMSGCQILLLLFYPNYALYLLTVVAKNITSNIIITVGSNKDYSYLKSPVNKEIYEVYKPRILEFVKDMSVSKIGAYVFYSTDNLILSIFRGSILAGFLSNYSMITQQVNNIITQVLSSVQAVFGNFVSVTEDKETQRKMTDNYFFVNSFLGIFCMLCVFFLIQPFIQIFFGKTYLLDDSTVFWLAVNLMLTIMIQLPSQIFIIYKLYHYDRPIIILSAILNIVISVVLVQKLSVDGVLIGTFVTSLIYLFSRFYIIGKYVYDIPYRHYLKEIFKYFFVAAISIFMMSTIYQTFTYADSLFFMIIKVGIVIILAATLPLCFFSFTAEYQFIVETMVPTKLKKFCSCLFILCFTIGVIVIISISGKYSNSSIYKDGNKSAVRHDSYENEYNGPETKIFHLSFDDVSDIFIDLTKHEDEYNSIFDNDTLAWMKEIHETYGVVISCYVFYQSDDFSLDGCTTKFSAEFEENMDWLRFGFHSVDANTVYGIEENSTIVEDYHRTVKCLKDICGGSTNVIRLHSYQGTQNEVVELMADEIEPVTALLSADDKRQSYYLDEDSSSYIYCHDEYTDTVTGMRFISTDIRMELVESIDKKINEFSSESWNNQLDYLVVFTHEWALDSEIKKKIKEICKYAYGNGYQFVFFEDTYKTGEK